MRIVYLGAEVSSHRTILNAAGVKAVGINYLLLKKRGLPKKPWIIEERVPDGVGVYVSAGLYDQPLTEDEYATLVDEYLSFLAVNADRLTAAEEPDSPLFSPKKIRGKMLDTVGDKTWPVYHDGMNIDSLCHDFDHVAIPGSVIEADTSLAGRTRALSGLYGTQWHAVAHARPDDLRSLPVSTVSTLAWLAPMLRGETVVWDGTKLVRYPAKMKDQARRRIGPICDRAGIDYDKILADDNKELAMLALWSYARLEENMKGGHVAKVVDNSAVLDDPGEAETEGISVDNRVVSMRKPNVPAQRQHNGPKPVLPVLGFAEKQVVDYENGHQVFKTVPVVQSATHTLRQCDTCFVAATCPAFTAGSECAFHLPLEVKTKDQLLALLNTMIEMQGQRVAFARFTEELQGGYPDPNVSQELDRLFKMVERLKTIQEDREFIQITAQRSGGSGVLSRIFGEKASGLNALPQGGYNEQQTTHIIADVIEG